MTGCAVRTLSLDPLPSLPVKMPPDDPEAVVHCLLELEAVHATVGALAQADEPDDRRVGRGHHLQQPLHLVEIADELWPCDDIPSTQSKSDRFIAAQIQLPVAAAGSEQRVAVLHVAHRLLVAPAGPAAGE